MLKLFRRKPHGRTIEALYGAIVAQARSPSFYAHYGAADSVQGRLDLLMLHLVLVFERLSRGDAAARDCGQAVFDRFCQDMDDHLREQGVSDLRVPKDMQRLGAAFFGRHRSYVSALKAGDREALRIALRRNVYGDEENAGLAPLVDYVEETARALERQAPAELTDGRIEWPDPAKFV